VFVFGSCSFCRANGAPWRDLPEKFGHWNSVFKRFRRWAKRGVFDKIFNVLSDDPDFEYVMVDGTIARVHRHGQEEKRDWLSGHRQVAWRLDHQDRGAGRWARQSGPFCVAAGSVTLSQSKYAHLV
jgi:hypothetical protein